MSWHRARWLCNVRKALVEVLWFHFGKNDVSQLGEHVKNLIETLEVCAVSHIFVDRVTEVFTPDATMRSTGSFERCNGLPRYLVLSTIYGMSTTHDPITAVYV